MQSAVFPAELEIAQKIALLDKADKAARAYDPRIKQVQASYVDETKHVLIVTSDGRAIWDLQPLVRLNVMCIAEENGKRQSGYQGGGGRRALDIFIGDLDPTALARESARQAILQLRAVDAPAGTDGGCPRAGLARHSAARSYRARTRSGFQSKKDIGLRRSHWSESRFRTLHCG